MSPNDGKILIVDDDKSIRDLLTRLLARQYQVVVAVNGEEALEAVEIEMPDLVLLDVGLPGIDGYEVCRRIKHGPLGARLHVIIVSVRSSHDDQLQAFEAGGDDYVVKPFDPHELMSRVRLHFRLRDALQTVGTVRSKIESYNAEIKRLADERTQEMIATQDVAVFTLAKVAESRDQETGDHLARMRAYSMLLAEELRLGGPYASEINQRFLDDLYRSAPLHDIGKVGISDSILLKPGKLTVAEFETMKRHTVIGANILDQAVAHAQVGGFLAMAAVIARFHHEKFDGRGYLAGLKGTEIPLPARIVALADVYDALTSTRPYKEAYDPYAARAMIEAESGRHFDPVIVEAFQARFDDFLHVREIHTEFLPLATGAMAFAEYAAVET